MRKQPYEERIFGLDFADKLATGVALSSVVSITIENQGNVDSSADVTESGETVSGTEAQALFAGGTDMEDYKVTWKCLTDSGEKVESEGLLKVREV